MWVSRGQKMVLDVSRMGRAFALGGPILVPAVVHPDGFFLRKKIYIALLRCTGLAVGAMLS